MRTLLACYSRRMQLPGTETGQSHVAPRISLLDGVRGIAICLVLAVHFTPDYLMENRGLEWVKKLVLTGWTGVDLFFVLSGFLITDILLRVRNTPGWVANFYARRALRILPLYLLALTITFGIAPWFISVGQDAAFDEMQRFQGWYWIHAANIVALKHGFDAMMSGVLSLSHLWSLAVEEHFYLIWPLLVARLPERRLLPLLGLIIVAAVVFRSLAAVTLPGTAMDGICVQTPARMDALAVGALLTLLFRRVPATALRKGAWIVFVATGAALAADFFIEKGLWPGSYFIRMFGLTLVSLFYGSFLALLLTSSTSALLRRAVDQPVLRFFGKYSYGIYVLHGMIVPALERWIPAPTLLAVFHSPILAAAICLVSKTAVSVALAMLSWRFIEVPCLRLKARFDYKAKADLLTTAPMCSDPKLSERGGTAWPVGKGGGQHQQ